MQANQLKRTHKNRKRMTVARGGKRGKTSGRGGKGQSARAGNKRRPEWRDIIKKMPKLRGRGVNQNKPVSDKPVIVNLGIIEEIFKSGDAITPTILAEKGVIKLVSGRIPVVKILGDGELKKVLKVSGCLVSKSAKKKIEEAKGEIVLKAGITMTKVPEIVARKKEPAPKIEKTKISTQNAAVKKDIKTSVKKSKTLVSETGKK